MKTEKNVSSFSPFSPAMLWEKRNRALLIQLLTAELIATFRCLCRNGELSEVLSPARVFFPYDWAYPYGHLNKAKEHALLLRPLFPSLTKAVRDFNHLLDKATLPIKKASSARRIKLKKILAEIFFALEPFIEKCKENENLIFFLLKHMQEIDQCAQKKNYLQTLLLRLHPSGLAELSEKLCDNYHHRGFYFLIPEIKFLFTQLQHAD